MSGHNLAAFVKAEEHCVSCKLLGSCLGAVDHAQICHLSPVETGSVTRKVSIDIKVKTGLLSEWDRRKKSKTLPGQLKW